MVQLARLGAGQRTKGAIMKVLLFSMLLLMSACANAVRPPEKCHTVTDWPQGDFTVQLGSYETVSIADNNGYSFSWETTGNVVSVFVTYDGYNVINSVRFCWR